MCTGIMIGSTEGNFFWGRTQEFAQNLEYNGVIIPRDFPISVSLSEFKTKYAIVGISAMGLPGVIDGVNEHGLSGGSFYFANEYEYDTKENVRKANKRPLAGAEFVTYALANYSSVEELKYRANKDTAIADADGFTGLPQHYVFQDKTGASVAIEPSIKGKYVVYDNPVGIFTNNPKFDWHLTNLENYVGLHKSVDPAIKMNDWDVLTSGKGSGLRGIPGDYTPQARFVRAAYLKQLSEKVSDDRAVNLLFHLLNSFDISKGVVQSKDTVQYTQYTSAYNLETKTVYIHTYDNKNVQTLTWTEEEIKAKELLLFKISDQEKIFPMKKKSSLE